MRTFFLLLIAVLVTGCGPRTLTSFQAGDLEVEIDPSGNIISLKVGGADVQAAGEPAPLLSLRVDSTYLPPESAAWDEETNLLTLRFDGERTAEVAITEKGTHARLEVVAISDTSTVELVVWGPYPTIMNDVIGETVGVVQEGGFALGLQALNVRTLGGFPWKENDAMPQLDIFESGDFSDLSEAGKRHVLYRVEAAKPEDFGSTLQAFTRNRNQARMVANMGYPNYLAPAYDDGGMVGSAIALFGAYESDALDTIGAIERAEGLPHPLMDGVWAKQASRAAQAYVIMPFSEETIDDALDVVERAGMQILYHPGPFATWGHFPLRDDDFPQGVQGLKRLSERAAERGIRLGGHTLSNFISTSDSYVTPVPDSRLAVVDSSKLTGHLSLDATTLTVKSPEPFRAGLGSTLKTVRIGDELIQYTSVSGESPWTLSGLQRGMFGTRTASHPADSGVFLLADHGYQVFLTNTDLSIEVAQNMGRVFSNAGLKHVSFDGLEGNRSTGMGNYGEILFAQAFWEAIPPADRDDWIVTASRTSHWFWHLYTRMNWGEPWYAGFRESQTEYRMKNQAYFRRNFMPAMLGWFSLRLETSLEDIEWMLARSAAYDAGYALSTSLDIVQKHGRSGEILDRLNRWERARLGGHFSLEQKKRMEDVAGEFTLSEPEPDQFLLTPIATKRVSHEQRERQPGEPSESIHSLQNPYASQTLAFSIHTDDGDIHGLTFRVGSGAITVDLDEGQTLEYRGGSTATVYSSSWIPVKRINVQESQFTVPSGAFTVRTETKGVEVASARVELRLSGEGEPLIGSSRPEN